MLKAVSLPTLLAATLLAATLATGSARADDHRRAAAIQPTSPQSIADVTKAGGGTVSGTVEKVAANWFVLTDGRDRIDVASRGFIPDGIQSGDQITVTGGVRQGVISRQSLLPAASVAACGFVVPPPHDVRPANRCTVSVTLEMFRYAKGTDGGATSSPRRRES